MRFLYSSLLLCVFINSSVVAQERTKYDEQFWLEGMIDYSFGVKWDFWLDANYKGIVTNDANYWGAMVRPNIKFKVLKWMDLRAGIGAFYTKFDENDSVLEIRPWEGFAIGWPKIKNIRLVHLFRVEQRVIYYPSDWTQEYSNRIRYQLSTRIPLNKNKKYKTFFIPLAIEAFFQNENEVNDFFRNRARYTVGLGYIFNREITLDFKLVLEQNRSEDQNLNITDTMFRLRFRYNLFSFEEDDTKL